MKVIGRDEVTRDEDDVSRDEVELYESNVCEDAAELCELMLGETR